MKRLVVPAVAMAALVGACGGGGQTQATRPSESFQGTNDTTGKHAKKVGDQRVTATAVFALRPDMTVHIEGGGGASPDRSSGSNCTKDETNDTFTTKSWSESHDFGFTAKSGGSCSTQKSWSYFKVSVKDSGGKEVGHGESLYIEGIDPIIVYHVSCDAHGSRWSGLNCRKTGDLKVDISS
jgi:hypothetical protein